MSADGTAYESLAEAHGGEERWAFGTGFDDPLAGLDTAVPTGVDARAVALQCLALGDDALVMSQRLAAWCSNAPELEDDVALANIALDLLGQARLLLTRAAQADPSLRPAEAPAHIPDEDALAYFREPRAYRNVRLAELDDGADFARCITRLFLFATWRLAVLVWLVDSPDPVLAATCAKAVTELTYHRDYAAGWVVRLGDGTDVSHQRMQDALEWAWPEVAELVGGDLSQHNRYAESSEFFGILGEVLAPATLTEPPWDGAVASSQGRDGQHSDALTELLADLQSVARANPAATW
ncbi:MAG: phenylacetate-CoA oxygenase subunit PaaI [Pseudonocardiales bacterium]|nr:MAG: phenylacetate-CoA oxygenase subunit PaaI [Pseudonocardiales bacterium]